MSCVLCRDGEEAICDGGGVKVVGCGEEGEETVSAPEHRPGGEAGDGGGVGVSERGDTGGLEVTECSDQVCGWRGREAGGSRWRGKKLNGGGKRGGCGGMLVLGILLDSPEMEAAIAEKRRGAVEASY